MSNNKKSHMYEAFDLELFFKKAEERQLKKKIKEEKRHESGSKRRN